ncbi:MULTISPECIES: hypothetical protein [unclassified Mesorhizobium]|uniref:hypothetical protein n=1 Tax=unclassified Mesorhizobium TaxID=325217 RepID=UPI000FD765B8|nr:MULTISPECIES: hypothetical protein [unclassified Mesorhizobium]TGR58275.1 hypothetical protein EN842_01395 [bacterium M00.F.Ca.ET.199.01.1.1]TGU41617.1 hypothetical protein EN799_03420 [bacterium M00.F.Ca.ET.156.01.1.1]TGV89759.1 hypothetical protein EN792_006265 [Mesorhizobium sp. M00.F.Ca.ET.149.01.1.1]TGR33017.1 hypothetical protein EN840_01395 [Mesorhizobium sp. M8A.F.Ca.ET.197.01.1.1]TGR34663.1 hypothetical protein EN845_01395 [Mesorhizobium sp. M8A.F.Ca.ET.202.01.1.1]
MHSAIRAGQVNDALSHDPYAAANDNLSELGPKTTAMPAPAILGWLASNDYIGADERDAGEHLIKLASITRSRLTSPIVRYTARSADAKWCQVEVQRHTVRPALEGCISAIRYEPRRKATVQAFVVEETNVDLANPHRVAQGLADVARHLWGTKKSAATPILAANDNEPEEDVAVAPVRKSDNFQRMHTAGQLDKDAETNDALHAAGLRYASDHYLAGLQPLGAIDYSRVSVDGGSGEGMGERMTQARDRYRKARVLLGAHYGPIVDAVVVDGNSLGEAGLKISHYKDRGKAIAAAGERLNGGLRLLAQHYGILRQ